MEGHSYTYEGSTWGKIVDILIQTKCMNPVIYFDELDKISDTPKGEEIVGVEITNKEIRLTQISSNKANQWVLERFYVHPINLPDDAAIVDHEQKVGDELNVALQKSKISTPNAAIAIPVTNAIIRVVTAPLMNDEELKKAIDTNSLWENLVQLTDNLDDYSIFHQVINRNSN